MSDVIEIAASLAESAICVFLCNGFLGFKSEKFRWLKSGVSFILLGLNSVLLSQLDGFENISVGILIALMLVYSFVFLKGKVWEKLLVSLIPTITALPISLIVINTLSVLANNERSAVVTSGGSLRFLGLFLTQTLFFVLCAIIVKIKRNQPYLLNRFQQVIQLSCFFISFVIATLLWNVSKEQDHVSPPFTAMFILIMLLNILLYILMSKMQRDNVTKEEYRLLKASLLAQEKLAVEVRERYVEMKTLRHDMKHCLTAAAELIAEGRANDAKEYIESVVREKINPAAAVISTGSAVIDAAISSKAALCAKNGMELKCMIDTRFEGENDMDMSILLSNLLDNAINGCDPSDPRIELLMKSRKSYLYITVKNKIGASVLAENPALITGKENKKEHGFGIGSIKNIAKKYEGSAEFSEREGYFIAEIWVKMKKNS